MKTLVILIGLPGSGKSTYAKELETSGYVRINQDAFNGDREATTKAFETALQEGKNVVLDRCNIDRNQRRVWINKAKQHNYEEILAVNFSVEPEICIERIKTRENHETIPKETRTDKVRSIVYGFSTSKEIPTFTEVFTAIIEK